LLTDIFPRLAGAFLPHVISRGSEKGVYLTFDDGPDPIYTPTILDLLAQLDVKTTFFVLGSAGVEYPEIIIKAAAEGHTIGIHGWHHRYMTFKSEASARDELIRCHEQLVRLTSNPIRYFRPPHGHIGIGLQRAVDALGLTTILWSYSPGDWKISNTRTKLAQLISTHRDDGEIILLHSAGGNARETLLALEIALPKMLDDGVKFYPL